ncbi:MAG: hypothetical protein GXP51_09755 [Deltaproteobacteria bacterium]|nr:hypothetical protein [Deltaproteobacteria bacterium]
MKIFVKLIVALVVVILLVAGGLLYYVDSMAKKAIEYGGSEALGVATTLDQINISLFSGTASLSGLKIANPSGFKPASFLRLGSGEFAVSLGSLNSDTVVIPKVRLANIQLNLDQKDGQNNIEPLLKRMKSMSGAGEKQSSSNLSDSGKKFILEDLEIENVQVSAALEILGQTAYVKMVLPKIELRDLGKDKGGLPMPQLVQTVVQVILDTAAQSSAGLSPELARLLKGQLAGLDRVKAKIVGKATAEVEKQLQKVQQQLNKQLKQVPLPAGTDKVLDEKTKQLLKGVKGLLEN